MKSCKFSLFKCRSAPGKFLWKNLLFAGSLVLCLLPVFGDHHRMQYHPDLPPKLFWMIFLYFDSFHKYSDYSIASLPANQRANLTCLFSMRSFSRIANTSKSDGIWNGFWGILFVAGFIPFVISGSFNIFDRGVAMLQKIKYQFLWVPLKKSCFWCFCFWEK